MIRNRNSFSLIAKCPATSRHAGSTPLKNNASVQQTASHLDKKQVSYEDKRGKKQSSLQTSGVKSPSQHSDKKQDSSDVRLAEQVPRDRARQKAYWKRIKAAIQLRRENRASDDQESRTVVSRPLNPGCLDGDRRKVAIQLRNAKLASDYAHLQGSRTVASPQVQRPRFCVRGVPCMSVIISHPKNSGEFELGGLRGRVGKVAEFQRS